MEIEEKVQQHFKQKKERKSVAIEANLILNSLETPTSSYKPIAEKMSSIQTNKGEYIGKSLVHLQLLHKIITNTINR